jgi:hypothetical protein
VAAAHAVSHTGGILRNLDIKQVQVRLVANGNLEQRVLTDVDSFPIATKELAAAVAKLKDLTIDVHQRPDYDETFPALAAVMSHPDASVPLLIDAYNQATDREDRTNFARILAVLGDGTGKATLLDAVTNTKSWDGGYGYTSHRKENNTFGPVDRLVIALGFLRDPDVRPALLEKLAQLGDGHLSQYKALCLAIRMNRDASFAKPLADHLANIGGHCQPLRYHVEPGSTLPIAARATVTNKGGDNQLNRKFKEVLIAALLVQCGDYRGQGRAVLEAYTEDVNGHFAVYADQVLRAR